MRHLLRSSESNRTPSTHRAAQSRHTGLSLERLEERWTPAVGFTMAAGSATITDDDSGAASNSIEIIDDLDTLTTSIKINNGAQQALGPSGALLNLTIQMGAGKDKVTFTTTGDAQVSAANVTRTIDLGSGDDSLTINLGGSGIVADGFELAYKIIGDTSGNDSYTVKGDAVSGTLSFDADTIPETAGNDKYNFAIQGLTTGKAEIKTRDLLGKDVYINNLTSDGDTGNLHTRFTDATGDDKYTTFIAAQNSAGPIVAEIVDNAGSDAYSAVVGASVAAAGLTLSINDTGVGSNSFSTIQSGLSAASHATLIYTITGMSSNVAKFGGNGVIDGSTFDVTYSGGDAFDSVTFDDFAVVGAAAQSQTFKIYTNGGNDRVFMRLDGSHKSRQAAFTHGGAPIYDVQLGAGIDTFSGKLFTPYFGIDSGDVGPTGLNLTVHGDGDSDSLSFTTDGKPMTIRGASAIFSLALYGDNGSDAITAHLGSIGASGGANTFQVTLSGGVAGGPLDFDKISLAGKLTQDSSNLTAKLTVDLDTDASKDAFESTFKFASSTPLATIDARIYHYVAGTDAHSLLKGSLAPTWAFL